MACNTYQNKVLDNPWHFCTKEQNFVIIYRKSDYKDMWSNHVGDL